MTTRRQFFRILGTAAVVSVAPAALTDAVAAIAPQVAPDPLGAWLPLNGDKVPVAEVPDLARHAASWVTDGHVCLPDVPAKVQELEHFVAPMGHYSTGAQVHTRMTERILPVRYMVKARADDSQIPIGTMMLFAN